MMVFAFFLVVIIDLFRLGNHFFHFFPGSWFEPGSNIKQIVFSIVTSSIILLIIIGAINARHIRIKELDINLSKSSQSLNQLNIVLASDIHLGTIIHNSRLENIVNKINNLNPDIILLAGDVFDEDISTLIEKNTASILAKFKSKYGVYAIPGNHEYFSGIDAAIDYLQQGQITVLRDSVSFVAERFYLVGRDDITGNRFNRTRKPLDELMAGIDKKYPIIVMDHQPFHLEEAQNNGVDLQVSGHTHHGQFFPFNLITNKIYELSWGYLQKGNTHYYVSCGVGTWGPPVRLGNRPEIVKINLELIGLDQKPYISN
jgi:predicted MPP superfamily phosphohydrolase